jgi:hypothetical protein
MKKQFLCISLLFFVAFGFSQEISNVQLKMYGHIQYNLDDLGKTNNSYFAAGEQDFFVTADLADKVSFLSESIIKYDAETSTKFSPSIERAQVKWDYHGNHSVIMGKIHTPVNTWNDELHHGRLFFPTIDRPAAFGGMVPLHTLGLDVRGQYLGRLNFGYDLVIGNSISSTDISDNQGFSKAVMAAIHIRPADDTRIGVSYFNDYTNKATADAHTGHSSYSSGYTGPLNFELFSFSFKKFSDKYEILNETGYNVTRTPMGDARNTFCFTYAGYNLNDSNTIYTVADYYKVSLDEMYSEPGKRLKLGLGYKHEISEKCNFKLQLEELNIADAELESWKTKQYGIKFQLAYGF